MFKKDIKSNLEIKKILTDVGLYETGMSISNMNKIYDTINTSKYTANNETEYRELLNQTETNCANIELLTIDSNNKSTNNDNSKTILQQHPTTKNEEHKNNTQIADLEPLIELDFFVKNNVTTRNSVKIEKRTVIPVLYHQHPTVLNLPIGKRAKKVFKYLQKLPRINVNVEGKQLIPWGKPILPSNKFNGDLCIDYIPEETESPENTSNDKKEVDNDNDLVTYSKRVFKRKLYKEKNSDEKSDAKLNKKTKTNIDKNENDENASQSKNSISKDASKIPFIPPKVSDRTKKLFKSLKQSNDNKKSETSQTREENMEFSDDDDYIFPITRTRAHVHKENMPKKNEQSINSTKNILTRSQTKSKLIEEKTQISAKSFYGKNKENELDLSNNNKSSTSNDMTQCPICSILFPNSEIQDHASMCDQFTAFEMDIICDICSKYVSADEIDSHKSKCLKEITEISTETGTIFDKNKRIGYLCSVCDKYVTKTSELDHASSCIANFKDK